MGPRGAVRRGAGEPYHLAGGHCAQQRDRLATLGGGALAVADETPLADQQLLADEADARLHRCLGELDPRAQGCIRSAFFDGLTYAELAARENVPLGTMKSWIRRGLMRLKNCLGDG